jgi:hypothetical protein
MRPIPFLITEATRRELMVPRLYVPKGNTWLSLPVHLYRVAERAQNGAPALPTTNLASSGRKAAAGFPLFGPVLPVRNCETNVSKMPQWHDRDVMLFAES